MKGTVVSIHIADKPSVPMLSLQTAYLRIGKGIEGDRYFKKIGTYSSKPNPGREVTLIEVESIEAIKRDHAINLQPGDARRNIVTRGVALNYLVGKTFRVGEITLRGISLCEPCSHLAKLTEKEVLSALVHRGGLRAQIVAEGIIRVGDEVEETEISRTSKFYE